MMSMNNNQRTDLLYCFLIPDHRLQANPLEGIQILHQEGSDFDLEEHQFLLHSGVLS